MERLLEALKRVNPNVDFTSSKKLVTDKVIDSIDITSILAELEEEFDIEIDMEYVTPENLDSVEAMWEMIQEMME
ncbi:MAG: acyl carrier protein [Eubacterium sp.]|nr:acyl carrier protein [Eubacterium sp.]